MNELGGGKFGWPVDPADCDDCRETLGGTGRCKYHLAEERRLEEEQRITEELPKPTKRPLLSEDIHDWAEQQKIGRDIAEEVRREKYR
jgi:hypothetical protein